LNLRISSPLDNSKVELLNFHLYKDAITQNSRLSSVKGNSFLAALVLMWAPMSCHFEEGSKSGPQGSLKLLPRYKIISGQCLRLQGLPSDAEMPPQSRKSRAASLETGLPWVPEC
jgi:hypothetical protein